MRHLGYRPGDFPVTEALAGKILSLPMFAELTPEQIHYVVDSLGQAIGTLPFVLAGKQRSCG